MPLLNEKTVTDILLAQQHQQALAAAAANGADITSTTTTTSPPLVAAVVLDLDAGAKQKMLVPIVGNNNNYTDNDVENIGCPQKRRSLAKRIPAFGLLMALTSVVCFSIGSVIVKVLTQMHSIQVLVIRCTIQFTFYTITALIYRYPLMPRRGHRLDLAFRCVSGTISLITIFVAYRLMPLADASTIHFASPVFVTIFAYFILKEPLTVLQVLTGTITLTGVVIIAKPEFLFGAETSESVHENRLLGTILASIAALTAALSMITLRRLKTTPVAVVVMWYSATSIVAGVVILIVLQKITWPEGWWTWTLLAGVGACGIGDQFFLTTALKYESAGPVSVTRTFNIVLSFIWEVVLLAEAVEWTSVLGACLVSSCVVILALDKWYNESPKLFRRLRRRLCCCCSCSWETGCCGCGGGDGASNLNSSSNSTDKSSTVDSCIHKQLPDSLRGSTDSIDSIAVQSTVHSNAILLKADD
ncbi:solute carrier family 35 member G1-like [Oppia nitens]|uniref:solute carrier family 35 member G1-like n=1 Tax=Oppia nitens TaxID=1686743 RepID=UPI0023DB67B4|nr:solute carrier family 35 member G1-like [Oppia nitens]